MSSQLEPQLLSKPLSNRKFQPYKPDIALRKQIKPLHQLDNWHGFLQIAEDWILIVIAISFSLVSWTYLPSWLALFIYCVTIVLIGSRQRGLRVNNHQATHISLFKNRILNYWVTVLFCTWPTLESYSGYDDTHNSKDRGHHLNLGTVRDLDHQAVVAQGLYQRDSFNFKHYLLTLPLNTPAYWVFLLKSRVMPLHEKYQERWMRLAFWLLLFIGNNFFHTWNILFCYWLVPLLTTANWVGSIIHLAEHYPLMEMEHNSEIDASRNRIMHPFWNIFLSTHQEGYHLIHHLFPKLPFWNMKKAHTIMMQDLLYASLHRQEGIAHLVEQIESVNKIAGKHVTVTELLT